MKAGEGLNDPWVVTAKVVLAELLGADALLNLCIQGETMSARVNGTKHPEQGQELRIRLNPQNMHVFDRSNKKALLRRNIT